MNEFAALFALAAGGVAAVALVELLVRRSTVGAVLVLAYALPGFAEVEPPTVSVAGAAVNPRDVLSVLLLAAFTARMLRPRQRLHPGQYLLLVVALIGALSLARGIAEFGLQTAVNEARGWLAYLSVALYFSTAVGATVRERAGTYIVWLGTALAGLAVIRWGTLATRVSLGGIFEPIDDSLRVIPSDPTFVVASAFFVLLPAWKTGGDVRLRRLSVVLLVVVALMQQRTVWIAVAIGLGAVLLRDRQLSRQVSLLVVAAVTTTVLALTVLGAAEQLERSATRSDTFAWRVEGWRELVFERGPVGPVDILLGSPFGTGWERTVDGQIREESPHNHYLEAGLRFGLLGLGALLAAYVMALRRTAGPESRAERPGLLTSDSMFYVLVMSLVYGVTYEPPASTAIIVGLALGAALPASLPAVGARRVQPPAAPTLRAGTRPPREVGLTRSGR